MDPPDAVINEAELVSMRVTVSLAGGESSRHGDLESSLSLRERTEIRIRPGDRLSYWLAWF